MRYAEHSIAALESLLKESMEECSRLTSRLEAAEKERDEARQAAEVEANESRRSHAARDAATAEAERLRKWIAERAKSAGHWSDADWNLYDECCTARTPAPSKEGE